MKKWVLFLIATAILTIFCAACDNNENEGLLDNGEVTGDEDGDAGTDKDIDLPKGDLDTDVDVDTENDVLPPTDNDIPSPWDDQDADDDGIKNKFEGTGDTDSDGTPDYLDDDSDGDGLPDSTEAPDGVPVDTDNDDTPDFQDTDSDNDGIPDGVEGTGDADSDGIPNYRDSDSDGDGLLDSIEAGGDPAVPVDTDSDGTPDYLDPDCDKDGIPDGVEGLKDADLDGIPNYLDDDSDGDGIPDSEECPQTPCVNSDDDDLPDFKDKDSDNDGLSDASEKDCANLGKNSRFFADTDEDGYSDLAEEAVGSDLCDAAQGVKDIVEFYFVLPYQDPEKTDVLTFAPTVQKADIHFNVDTTGSMSGEIDNLKSGLSTIMTETKSRVADSAFGVSYFEDFPACEFGNSGDQPWELLQSPTTDTGIAQAGVDKLSLGGGNDFPESGYEALYQLATGAGGTFALSGDDGCGGSCTASHTIPAASCGGLLGGACFRIGSIPIAIHVTDATSHVPADYGLTYHSRDEAVTALNALGVRTVTVQSGSDGDTTTQLNDISNSTGARVPVCAFKTGESSWRCGAEQCCTLNGGATAPSAGICTLRYQIPEDGTSLGSSVVDGVDAIIKYATFSVLTVGKDDGDGGTIDTACFLKMIEALSYVAPPAEPEKSCTPVATPAALGGAAYNNGFANFAPGTSDPAKEGAKLLFTVHAQNDTCFKPTSAEAQVFTAYIDVRDQVTGAVLDTQTVTIIVPGVFDSGGED